MRSSGPLTQVHMIASDTELPHSDFFSSDSSLLSFRLSIPSTLPKDNSNMSGDLDEFFRQQDLIFSMPDETVDEYFERISKWEEKLASRSARSRRPGSSTHTVLDLPDLSTSHEQAKDAKLKHKTTHGDGTGDAQTDHQPTKRVRIDTTVHDRSGVIPSITPALGNTTGTAGSGVLQVKSTTQDRSRPQEDPRSVPLASLAEGEDSIILWSENSRIGKPLNKATHGSSSVQRSIKPAAQDRGVTGTNNTEKDKPSKEQAIRPRDTVLKTSSAPATKSSVRNVATLPTSNLAKESPATKQTRHKNSATAPAAGPSRQPAATASRVKKANNNRPSKYSMDENSTDGSDGERKRAAPDFLLYPPNKRQENETRPTPLFGGNGGSSSLNAFKSVRVTSAQDDPLAQFYEKARADRDAVWLGEDGQESPLGASEKSQDKKGKSSKRGFTCDEKGPPSKCVNQDIVDKLQELQAIHEARPTKDDKWRVYAYRKAIAAIRRYSKRITSRDEAFKISGVGSKTADKIEEILETGDLRRIQYENTPDVKATAIFRGIYGVGQQIAWQWYAAGCRTLEDVKARKGDIKVSAVQEIGIKYYADINDRMPRVEVQGIFDRIKPIALKLDPVLFIEVMGSFRRGKADCGDIDILITRPTDDGRTHRGILRQLLRRLHQEGILTEDLSVPDDPDDLEAVYRGLCRRDQNSRHRRIDFLVVPWKSRGVALLYYTGDDIFNRAMRYKANTMGYSLNQRGLYAGVVRDTHDRTKKTNTGNIIASETEEEIFRILGIPWQEPHERIRS
ncbi:hypothetical protein NEOLEDRAFT_1141515 [Neolentinus lepideus HHB14362 ss-1]|uniref:DNA-directed DNA polymerase n=1 Tax=Neolentinus lepideus HHB14362 ss-1 TaxID=1314782 RepID=A0A165NN93_9AGAM|nr:hypothetical protein NEOLEDRAFT_1141515 [Neolentinus lepideus HHB14362 ss-1]